MDSVPKIKIVKKTERTADGPAGSWISVEKMARKPCISGWFGDVLPIYVFAVQHMTQEQR